MSTTFLHNCDSSADWEYSVEKFKALGPVGILMDPPWDKMDLYLPIYDLPSIVFAGPVNFKQVIEIYGPPDMLFVWNCMSCCWTPGRPLQRCKYALWYQNSGAGYVQDGARIHYSPTKSKYAFRNSRGEYHGEPHPDGMLLPDCYDYPISAMRTRNSNGESSHAKPSRWINALIANCLSSAEIILDPFAGEGTFLRPSIRNGKAYAGWEIDPERFEEMRKQMPDDEKFPCGSIQLDLFQ